MRISDRIRLSFRYQRGKWILPVLGFTIASFCLCFSGAIWANVQDQMANPCELDVLPRSDETLNDWMIADMEKITDVKAATPLLPIDVTIQTGKLSAQMTLTGINATYITDELKQGTLFPNESVMPYIVLNEEAINQLLSDEIKMIYQEPSGSDWLAASYSVQTGDRPITAKVCGILKSTEGDPSAGYISLWSARQLLQRSGQSTAYTSAWLRVTDIGSARRVSSELAARGLIIMDPSQELQAVWDADLFEMGCLMTLGIFALLCTVVLMTLQRRVALIEQKQEFISLCWMGLNPRVLQQLFVLQAFFSSLIGTFAGIIAALSLPSFLITETASSFTMQIPFLVIAAVVVINICVGLMSLLVRKPTIIDT